MRKNILNLNNYSVNAVPYFLFVSDRTNTVVTPYLTNIRCSLQDYESLTSEYFLTAPADRRRQMAWFAWLI